VLRWDGLPSHLASPASGFLLLLAQVGQEAVVVLAAGRAALQVRPQPGDDAVRFGSREFELDVAVQRLEALLAGELRLRGAQHAGETVVVEIRCRGHGELPSSARCSPRSESWARSLRRASW